MEKHDVMVQRSEHEETGHRCYALCVGIGTYSNLSNRNLRYAVADATVIADRLADPQRGTFTVTVLNEPTQTTREALDEAVTQVLSGPGRRPEDLALLYFSCHGDINPIDHTFCLLPSNASLQTDGQYDPTTLIGITDFARWFANATIQNIVVLLDVCHSGGAGAALQQFTLQLDAGPNFFFIGAARSDQAARQSSRLQHGLFTYCLLRAFEQPPTSDGWLTVSQIHTFISDELPWFTKEHPISIQSWSVSVNPNMPLVRNPGYPELAPLPPVWNVPLQRNVFFTGQEELLSLLASMLQGTRKTALTQPHALSGLGGIGKTQLALEYAYQHRQDYHAVLWGHAESTEALISSFLEIAQVLDLPQKDEPDQNVIIEAVKTWLSNRSHWLFILDNADDVGLVQAFLPPTFRGHLLLTTRAQAMGKIVESKLEVEAMRPEIGALFLLRRARIVSKETTLEEAPDEAVTQAKGLAEELGGLPLALDQAGAYIEVTGCSLADYQQQYRTRRAELLALRNGPAALPGAWKDDHPEAVATTWSLSFAKVEQASPIATELLRACAFLAPDAIPEELLVEVLKTPLAQAEQLVRRGGWFSDLTSGLRKPPKRSLQAVNEGEMQAAVAILRAYSLLERNTMEKTVRVHRLVQAVIRDALEEYAQDVWITRIVGAVDRCFPEVSFETWGQCERYLPHALACHEGTVQHQLPLREGVALLYLAAWYLYDRARYAEAEPLLMRVLAISEQQLGANHPDTADCLNNLAELYQSQGKDAEAEPLLMRALAIREKRLGANHPDAAQSLNNLAELYRVQRQYAEAEPLLMRALAIRERQLGAEHPDTAISLNSLANLYHNQGKYAEAEPLLVQALAIFEQQLGAEHLYTASTLNNLALLYKDQGKYAEAEPLYVRALAIFEQQLGAEHPSTMTSLNNLAALYCACGKYREARPLLERALEIYEHVLGRTHPQTQTIHEQYMVLVRLTERKR